MVPRYFAQVVRRIEDSGISMADASSEDFDEDFVRPRDGDGDFLAARPSRSGCEAVCNHGVLVSSTGR